MAITILALVVALLAVLLGIIMIVLGYVYISNCQVKIVMSRESKSGSATTEGGS